MYDDKHMLKVVQHATASALNYQEATATFLLLPNWMENSTNTFYFFPFRENNMAPAKTSSFLQPYVYFTLADPAMPTSPTYVAAGYPLCKP